MRNAPAYIALGQLKNKWTWSRGIEPKCFWISQFPFESLERLKFLNCFGVFVKKVIVVLSPVQK